MKKQNNYLYILIFIGFLILAYFFPLTGEDLLWSTTNYNDFYQILKEQNLGLLSSSILMVLTKIKLLKILTISILSTSIFILIKNIVNKRNDALIVIGLFLIFLLDKTIFSNIFSNTTGFVTHAIGSIFLLIFLKLFINNSLVNMNKLFLIILGFTSTCIYPLYSFIILISTFFYTFSCKESDFKRKYLTLFLGEIIGILLTASLTNLIYSGFSNNLLNEFIPNIKEANFFITLINSSLILFISVKNFKGNKRLPIMFSVISILTYLILSLLVNNHIIIYLSYVLNFLGSYYILTNSNTNKLFSYKIKNYYFFKLLFIIVICFFGNITPASFFFLVAIDILVILEIYNNLFPTNFLKYPWILVSIFFLITNIYLYHNAYNKHIEMNRFIKNELECHTKDFSIPSKYENDYIYKNIPTNKKEYEIYINFYNIKPYDKHSELKLHFTK